MKLAHEAQLLALPGVVGVGIGENEIGDEAIVVYLEEQAAAAKLPADIESVPVIWEVTGPIDAQGN